MRGRVRGVTRLGSCFDVVQKLSGCLEVKIRDTIVLFRRKMRYIYINISARLLDLDDVSHLLVVTAPTLLLLVLMLVLVGLVHFYDEVVLNPKRIQSISCRLGMTGWLRTVSYAE